MSDSPAHSSSTPDSTESQAVVGVVPPEVVWQAESSPPIRQPLLWVLIAVCLGAVVDRYLVSFSVTIWSIGCVMALAIWLGLWFRYRSKHAVYFVLLAASLLMAAWHHAHWNFFRGDDIGLFAQEEKGPAYVEAIVDSSVQILRVEEDDPMQIIPQTDRSVADVQLVGIRDADRWIPTTGKARLTVAGHLLGVRAGDRVRVVGQLQRPAMPKNPGQRNAAAYHRGERRLAMLHAGYPDSVSVLEATSTHGGTGWFARLRTDASRLFARYLDPSSAGLASALLLGVRSELDPELKSAFVETSTMHLLAISGFHVGLLAWFLFSTLQMFRVSLEKSSALVAIVILFYALLTDANPPVVRATVLVWVFCLSQILKRNTPAFNSLAMAGLVVMALNPTSLFQVGPQLSFLAVATILWFAPTWERILSRQQENDPGTALLRGNLWNDMRLWFSQSSRYLIFISINVWLITLPLTLTCFHLISPVGPLLNAVLWIPVTVALAGGFLLLVVGVIFPPLAFIVAWVMNPTCHVIDWIVSQAAELPGSHYWVAGPSTWWILGFYLLLGVGLFLPRRVGSPRWPRFAPVAWVGLGFFVAALTGPPKELRATVIAVGHGSATLIQTTSGKNVLCDCGCFASGRYGADAISNVLWSRGVRRLDGVFLSHADADHYNALPGLIERFSIKTVYVPPQMFFDEPDNRMLAAMHQAVVEAGIEIREIQSGDLLTLDPKCRIKVLHPAKRYALESNNANSLVLLVEQDRRRLLLPGDLESHGIKAILAEEPIECDVLVVPHHGSRNSSSPELARWCCPQHAIVSNGADPLHIETKTAYERQGAQLYQTGRNGAIDVALSGRSVTVTPFVQ